MLALLSVEAEIGPHGIPMDVAMDPKNAWRFASKVETDFAAKTLADDSAAFYKLHFTDKKRPINDHGHLWSVRLKKDGER